MLITTSDLDISLLIRQQDEDAALEALHKAFRGLIYSLTQQSARILFLPGMRAFCYT